MCTLRCPQEQPEAKLTKNNEGKKTIPIYWRMLNKLSFIHTMECENEETIAACDNRMHLTYCYVKYSQKIFNMILSSWSSKTSKSSNTHTKFLNSKEMINTLKFRVIKCKGRGFESSGVSRTLFINKQVN